MRDREPVAVRVQFQKDRVVDDGARGVADGHVFSLPGNTTRQVAGYQDLSQPPGVGTGDCNLALAARSTRR